MDELPGTLGTSSSLALRLGQAIFSVASLLFMCLDVQFYSYTPFWYLEPTTHGSTSLSWEMLVFSLFMGLLTVCLKYSFLVTIMGLVIPWNLTLALVDAFSVFVKRPPRQPGMMSMIVIGDWVLSFLSLAASCSTASVADLMLASGGTLCSPKLCSRYQLSAAMAFLSWFLSLVSSLFNFWVLPSL